MAEVSQDIAALTLFLSREKIDPKEYDLGKALCSKVTDWKLFTAIAARKFIIPMVYGNLLKIKPENLPASELQQMKNEAMAWSMKSLHIASAQSKFHKLCIEPANCRHVLIKGLGIALRYYDNPGLRFSRDVDVLVSEDAIERVVRLALSNGYRVKIREDVLTSTPCEDALRALLKYDQIITLLSPESVWFEVHSHIDYGLELFDPKLLLETGIPLDGTENGLRVPSTAEIFCFVCYHSARHTWSRLHWLADINAIMEHPSFVLSDVKNYAARIGLVPTITATLEFKHLCETAEWVNGIQEPKTNGQALLLHSIANLADDSETELELRAKFGYLGLPYSWMLDGGAKLPAYLHRTMARITPSYYLYEKLPLPKYLQWMYYPIKPFFVLWHRIILRQMH